MGSRLNVQFARGGRERREPFYPDRPAPRTRRTLYRLNVTGLQGETSWQVRLTHFGRRKGVFLVATFRLQHTFLSHVLQSCAVVADDSSRISKISHVWMDLMWCIRRFLASVTAAGQ